LAVVCRALVLAFVYVTAATNPAAVAHGLALGRGHAAFIAYFWFNHSLQDYWQVAFVYNFIYSEIPLAERLAAFAGILRFLLRTSPVFSLALLSWILLAGKIIEHMRKRRFNLPFPLIIAAIDFPIEVMLICISGENYPHYFISLLPALSI